MFGKLFSRGTEKSGKQTLPVADAPILGGTLVFGELDAAVGVPKTSDVIVTTLGEIRREVAEATLAAGDPVFREEIVTGWVTLAKARVMSVVRGVPTTTRLDDRAAVMEAELRDRARHEALLRKEEAADDLRGAAEAEAAARKAVGSSPVTHLLWLIVFWLLIGVAMTFFMYETFVSLKAANAKAFAGLVGGGFLSRIPPADLALYSCLALTFGVTSVLTGLAWVQGRLGFLAKVLVIGMEAAVALALYWMRSSGQSATSASSMAYASVELVLAVIHGLGAMYLGGFLKAAVERRRAVEEAATLHALAKDEAAHRATAAVEAETKYAQQVAWYTRLTDHLAWQANLQLQAAETAELAYRLALQQLASRLLDRPAAPAPRPKAPIAKSTETTVTSTRRLETTTPLL